MVCDNGHPMCEASRRTVEEEREDVIYVKQRIKHFDREGSEFWTEIEVPDIVTRRVPVAIVEYRCDACQETRTVREEVGAG